MIKKLCFAYKNHVLHFPNVAMVDFPKPPVDPAAWKTLLKCSSSSSKKL